MYNNPFDLSLLYFPKEQLCLPIAENMDKHHKHLLSLSCIKEFDYWDNTDKPDDISDNEWSQRELEWSEATKNYVYPHGYPNAIPIEIFKEEINHHKIMAEFQNNKQEYLKTYLIQSIKANSVTLFGTLKQKEQEKDWTEHFGFRKLSQLQNELYEKYGKNELDKILPIYSKLIDEL